MKKIFVSLLFTLCINNCLNAQTYYYMWRGSGQQGKSEWIANSHLLYSYAGILFETTDLPRASVNNVGKWIFYDPNDSQLGVRNYIERLNTQLNNLDASNYFQGTTLSNKWGLNQITQDNKIDSYWGYGYYGEVVLSNQRPRWFRIESNGGLAFWGEGGSQINNNPQFVINGKSVDMYTKFNYYDSNKVWMASLDFGRNNDLLFSTKPNSWFRVSTPGGLAIWANGKASEDDIPTLHIGPQIITATAPFLQKGGAITFMEDGSITSLALDAITKTPWLGTTSNNGILFGANSEYSLYLDTEKNVFVNIEKAVADKVRAEVKSKYDLFVKSGVLSEDFSIAPINSWADHVFDADYKLNTIEDVEKYINDNHHLPEVPTAKEVATEGYSQHELNVILLKKIEELTLYIIKQQKEIEELKSK